MGDAHVWPTSVAAGVMNRDARRTRTPSREKTADPRTAEHVRQNYVRRMHSRPGGSPVLHVDPHTSNAGAPSLSGSDSVIVTRTRQPTVRRWNGRPTRRC